MELQAQLTLDTGPFAAALTDALAAVEKLAGETGGLAAAVEEARSRLAELGGEANAAAGAQETAAQAAEELSGAQKKGAEIAAELAARQREAAEETENAGGAASAAASGGLAVASAASAAMRGNVIGAAQGVLRLKSSLAGLGAAAAPIAAAVAALLALGAAVMAYRRRVEELKQERLDNIFDNATNSAKGLAGEIARANRELERQNNLKRALAGVADDGRRGAQEAELAKLEWERHKALSESGFDEEDAQINREFDRRRAEMEYRHAGENSRAEMDADKAKKAENAAGIETRQAQINELTAEIAAAIDKSMAAGQAGDLDEQKRWSELAASMTAQSARLRGEMDALEDANKVLDAKLANWGDAYGFNAAGWRHSSAMAQYDADTARASRALNTVDAESLRREGVGVEHKKERRGARAEHLSDSLARIGGYVGAAVSDRAAEKAQRERENQTRILQTIERNTRDHGVAVLA